MSDEELILEAKTLIDDFKSLELYKRFTVLKDALLNDKRLSQLEKERKKLQSQMKYLEAEKKAQCLAICKQMKEEYDEDPLVTNYRRAREELIELLRDLLETGF